MATPDAASRLAYTDASTLFELIETNWHQFEPALLPKSIWLARVEELLHIRNRIGHCRRPHVDDMSRLKQTLRDLEGGAFAALASFNRQFPLRQSENEPLCSLWVNGEHEVASRLLRHAATQYEADFELCWSRRPWAEGFKLGRRISGQAGFLWHARWFFRGSAYLDLRRFWNRLDAVGVCPSLVLVCASSSSGLEVSFPAVDDPDVVADAIGQCFDAVVSSVVRSLDLKFDEARIARDCEDLDPRVDTNGPWSVVDDSTIPITIFAA